MRLKVTDPAAQRIPLVRRSAALRLIGLLALAGALALTIVNINDTAVVLGLGAVIVLLMAWCFQGLWLEHLVRSPGPILVRELTGPADVSEADFARLSSAFRRRLMALRLQAPTPVPGSIPQQDFLDTLSTSRLDSKDLLTSSVSIMRAAVPPYAYEVSAALVRREASPDGLLFGVTAQVRLPHEVIPIDTVWASTWQDAVTEAADVATAVVLPRTGFSNRPPWSGWRGYTMPAGLVHHFERAEDLTTERRYDEALDRYFSALELDPKSVDLRLRKGYVQEKLGLFIDALATYAAARKMADNTSRTLYGRRARRNRKASGRIASYRLAVLLSGVDVAHQWRKPDGEGESIPGPAGTIDGDRRHRERAQAGNRDQQRVRLRECLRPELVEMLKAHKLIVEPPAARTGVKGWLSRAAWGKRPIEPIEPIEPIAARAAASGPPPWSEAAIDVLLKEFAAPGPNKRDDDDEGYYPLRNVLAALAMKELAKVRRQATGPRRAR